MEDTFVSSWECVYLLAHEVYPVALWVVWSMVADHLCTEEMQLHCSWCMWSSNFSEKTSCCFNHRVITLIANKLERQLLWEVYFGMEDHLCKATWEGAAQFILQPQCTENPQNIWQKLQKMHFKVAVRNFAALDASRWFPNVLRLSVCCGCNTNWAAASQVA